MGKKRGVEDLRKHSCAFAPGRQNRRERNRKMRQKTVPKCIGFTLRGKVHNVEVILDGNSLTARTCTAMYIEFERPG